MTEATIEKFQNIIVESISNVLCIDEQYIEPYMGKSNKNNRLFTKKVYEAFTKELKCRTVIYPYKGDDNGWSNYLDEQDLLVVDWQLTTPNNPQKPLDIIEKAIENHIQYVCVYTSNDGKELAEVINLVKSYFWGLTEKEVNDAALNASLAGIGESLTKRIVTSFISESAQAKEYKEKMICEGVKLGRETKDLFNHCEPDEWNKLFCKYVINPPGYSKHAIARDYIGAKSIVVDDTYIFFVTKGTDEDYNPKTIVETIAIELSSAPRSVFNVLWIYYFALLRESIYRKSNLPLKIPSDALKYHAKSAIEDEGETQYFSSILEMVVDEIVECIYKGESLKPGKEIVNEIESQGQGLLYSGVARELMTLNALMNINNQLSVTEHQLVLGDIFSAEVEANGEKKLKYFMCVSALCDCMNPKRLSSLFNSYSFITGDKSEKVIDNPEEEHLSFVVEGEKVYHIDWNKTVYGGYVDKDKNIVSPSQAINVHFEDKEYELKYICSIKDKYAQRLANHAFSWGLRVGTTYAKKCRSEK